METPQKNLKKFLYLTPFRDNKFFKIGISSNSNSRLVSHNKNFNIDFENTLIFTADKQSILDIIEKEVLIIFPQCEHPYLGNDGSTEIREIKHLTEIINIINNKPEILGIKLYKYNDLFKCLPISETKNEPSGNRNRKTERAEQELKGLEFKENFLKLIETNKHLFKKYYFDRHDHLVLSFDYTFPHDHITMCHIYCFMMKGDGKKVSFNFKYPVESDKELVSEYDINNINYLNKICSILGIKPTKEDLKSARKKEKDRIRSIDNYFDLCFESDTPIALTDIMNGQSVPIKPSLLFHNLLFVENQGCGFYWLHYMDGTIKCVFYNNGNELVKGQKSSSGYCYDSIEEKNHDYRRMFKNSTLLQNRFLFFNKKVLLYFLYLIQKKHDVLFSISPNYAEAFPLKNLDYTNFHSAFTLNQIQKKVIHTFTIKQNNNSSTIDYSL